jgi:hypothetical protein
MKVKKTKIVIAVGLCDRKISSQVVAVPTILDIIQSNENLDLSLYINIETNYHELTFQKQYRPLTELLNNAIDLKRYIDLWTWNSSWKPIPRFDQDQARLPMIIIARNMAREYFLSSDADYILYVDADVIIQEGGIEKLVEISKFFNRAMVGGLVPGRGAHRNVFYVSKEMRELSIGDLKNLVSGYLNPPYLKEGIIECNHGTAGYMLVRRDLMSMLSFRSGLSREDLKTKLSEDPAFCSDAFMNGFGRFWIVKDVKASHWDDPENPMLESNEKGMEVNA